MINKEKIHQDLLDELKITIGRRYTINRMIMAIVQRGLDSLIEEIERNGLQAKTEEAKGEVPDNQEAKASGATRGRPAKATSV